MPPVKGHAKPCGAKTRQGGKCQQKAMKNGRCRMHGGTSPSGIASPHFKTGARSKVLKHLPPAWAPHFDASSPDAERLTNELHVLEAAIIDVYTRMNGKRGITGALKKELGELYERKARLVAVHSRQLKDEHEMVSRDEFGRFAKAVLMAVATHVLDAATRGKIQEDVLRVLAISQVALTTVAAS